jgi:hypothetical protein
VGAVGGVGFGLGAGGGGGKSGVWERVDLVGHTCEWLLVWCLDLISWNAWRR